MVNSTIEFVALCVTITICMGILAIVFYYMLTTRRLGKEIDGHQAELDRILAQPESKIQDAFLQIVYDDYTSNLDRGGVHKLNTRALIDSHKPAAWYKKNSMLVFFSAAVITLGLLGTFVGFTITLQGFSGSMSNLENADTAKVVEVLKTPMAGISVKFFTSLVGLVAALVMGWYNSARLRPKAERFDDALVSFLDNTIAPYFAKDTSKTIEEALNRIEANMNGNIRQFSTNVSELSSSMDRSVGTLNEAVHTLENSVVSLNGAIRNMSDPLEQFAQRIDGFGAITQKLDLQIRSIESVSEVLADHVVTALSESLDRSVAKIDVATANMAAVVGQSADGLKTSVNWSIEQLERVMGGLKGDLQASVDTNRELARSIESMSKINDGMQMAIDPLQKTVSALEENIRRNTENAKFLVDEGIRAIERSTTEAADRAIHESAEITLNMLRSGLAPTIEGLQASAAALRDIIAGYGSNLGGIIEELKSTNADTSRVLLDSHDAFKRSLLESYMDYKQTLASYERQLRELSSVVDRVNRYVVSDGRQKEGMAG